MAANEQQLQAVPNQQQVLSFNQKELETIRRTVAKNATDDEFRMFMHLAQTYQLDPFNKEIWFIKYAKKGQNPKDVEPTIMTSRDGYLKIADRHPEYDGLSSDVVRKNDVFKRTMDGVEHEYSSDRGQIIGAYALVYRKDRKYPIYVFAPFNEYKGNAKIWNNYPSAMILKVAESMALKRAFTVSGLVSKEEMDVQSEPNDSNGPIDITPADQGNEKLRELTEREKEIAELVAGDKGYKQIVIDCLEYNFPGINNTNKKVSINDLDKAAYKQLVQTLQNAHEANAEPPDEEDDPLVEFEVPF
ncbi:phage recombination protein Bet [Iocasia frigidifontis]|uniref:phage recombination protein Bet n=1 Tax=Iocasia fonsfrigidae TaxID=2682810 RepID=UPI001E318FE1|nr:phage recombination protein Bet [Iocasia fonsfrigidae]